jgi:hypothetical protein
VTNAVSVDTSWAWRTFPFPTPITCPAGSYKLAWNSQSVRLLERYEIGGNKWVQYYTYNGFPDPYAPTAWYDRLISIYATYTPLAVITHNITINSSPITGIPVTMDGATIGNTPITVTVEEGSHTFAVPSEVTA